MDQYFSSCPWNEGKVLFVSYLAYVFTNIL